VKAGLKNIVQKDEMTKKDPSYFWVRGELNPVFIIQ